MTKPEEILLEALRDVRTYAATLRPHEILRPEQLALIDAVCVKARRQAAAERRKPVKALCPTCKKGTTSVLETKPVPDRWLRIRECKSCGARWRTEEIFIREQRSLSR